MFGMGVPEIMLILAIALIVIGPKKLPELAKSLGRALNEFKNATSELKGSFELDNDMKDVKKTFDDVEQELKKPIDMTPEKKEAGPKGESSAETDGKGADDDDSIAEVYAPEEPPEEAGSTLSDSVEKKEEKDDEDDHPATDIPAELTEDATDGEIDQKKGKEQQDPPKEQK